MLPHAPGEVGSETSAAAEVHKVVELILEHAQSPEKSLGVIAMGIRDAERIQAALRDALRTGRRSRRVLRQEPPEPFFIKNLERVQGDERDAIILSVGYGKSADGRIYTASDAQRGRRRASPQRGRDPGTERMTSSPPSPVTIWTLNAHKPAGSTPCGYLAYAACDGARLGSRAASIPKLNAFEGDIRDR